MIYKILPGTELTVSEVCLGTMTFGEQNSEMEAHKQLDTAVGAGINFIDTAEMYPVPARAQTQGLTEKYVGTWLKKQKRDSLVLATKIAGPNRGMEWMRGGPQFNRTQIIAACESSLQRLKTDYIDLYQLHWPARNVPMFGQTYFDPNNEKPDTPDFTEQLETLGGLIKAGKIRYIGISNETPWGVMKCREISRSQNLPMVSTIQNAFNLINRSFESGLAEVCYRESLSLMAYSPLAFGLLSGKYLDNPAAVGRMTQFANFGSRYQKPHVNSAVASYSELARKHGFTPAQMALAWVKSRWHVACTIIGSTTQAQLEENLSAFDRQLTPELESAIEDIHRQCPSPAQ